ncbi:flagellar biosynthetic protein FliO [Alteromonas sp. ASW11-130]|uniref:flagellar biosynthetic protein FliO n=1 Tax=Alteromonas sp. ASW11-130 TaxID=3015775 RepID=UPI002241E56C|nr:flagellar biosynthetic protein FliO [Alteromonas sp. ASW11-130]MCW8090367.1 flagellar biosynthetic protein FliO [Alteromonas sp. ASW11-130]
MLPLGFSSTAVAQSTQSITNPTSVLSIFLSLLLVVAIIFALAYVMRRFNVTHSSNGQLKVVASMMAGAKERIMVIEVGDEQHLVGITSQSISHLSKLENSIQSQQPADNPGALFKQKLVSAMAGKLNTSLKEEKHHG